MSAGSLPSPPTPPAPPTPGYRVPSLAYRIIVAALRLIVSFVVFVALPVAALAYVRSRGLPIPVSIAAVTTWGIVLLLLSAARYILKPTVAYGPLTVVLSGVLLGYLYYLVLLSPYRLTLPGGIATVAAGYSTFLELLMIAPALELVSGVLTTVEDVVHPKERLPFDYPV